MIVATFTKCQSLQYIAFALTNFWLRWLIWRDQLGNLFKYIPKYFTWFDGLSFFPHSFKFRSQSSLFFLSSIGLETLSPYWQVSSSKWKASECFIAMLRLSMRIKKRKGPRTEPCGTPYFRVL